MHTCKVIHGYFRYECEPGEHVFWAKSENRDFITADLEAGKIYFVQAGVRWTWLDTIPVNVPFLDESYYTVNYKTPDSFAVSWPKVKPILYYFSASFNIGEFLLTAPGDSTVLDPEILLARFVQGKLLTKR